MLDDDKLIEQIKEKLAHHEMPVSDDVWQGIEARLSTPVKWYNRHSYRIAAAVVVAIIVMSFWIFNIPYNTDVESPSDETIAEQITEIQPIENIHQAPSNNINKAAIISSQDEYTHTTIRQKAHRTEKNKMPEEKKESIAQNQISKKANSNVVNIDTPLWIYSNDAKMYDDRAMKVIADALKERVQPRNWLSLKASTMSAQTSSSAYVTRAADNEIVYRHNMPLSVKALFEKRFGRWGVGSGVAYTYMSAEYETTDGMRKGVQDLHYLGIPLYVSFELAQIQRFSFYTSLGGEIDFNISGTQYESHDSKSYPMLKNISVLDKNPQLSAQLHLGTAFELFKHFQFYIEPTLGCYFYNGSQTHSIWHDRPWSVSLSFGVRTGF